MARRMVGQVLCQNDVGAFEGRRRHPLLWAEIGGGTILQGWAWNIAAQARRVQVSEMAGSSMSKGYLTAPRPSMPDVESGLSGLSD
jgi:hypothetical protein